MVTLGPFSERVPEDVRALVEQRRKGIVDESFPIFKGPLKDQSGRVRVAEGGAMSLKDILSFDWLLQGIEGQSPTAK